MALQSLLREWKNPKNPGKLGGIFGIVEKYRYFCNVILNDVRSGVLFIKTMKTMRIKAIVLFFVFISGFSAFGQNLPDTVRIPLSKVDMPVCYCSSDWMGYNKELVRDPAEPTRINIVRTKLRKDFPISIDFSKAGSVTYSFP